jgi:hypothetical protein
VSAGIFFKNDINESKMLEERELKKKAEKESIVRQPKAYVFFYCMFVDTDRILIFHPLLPIECFASGINLSFHVKIESELKLMLSLYKSFNYSRSQ